VAAEREISPRELARRAAAARFVLLGEKHDHPDHHRLQAWIVLQMVERGRRPVVAFEMFGPGQREAIESHRDDPDGLARAARWEESGWPDWELYRPLVAAVLGAKLEIVPANLSRDEISALRDSRDAPPPALQRLSGAEREELREEIDRAHCGLIPKRGVEAMVWVQAARDARMAEAMLRAPRDQGAVLIAGRGHVRRDRGVPAHLEGAVSPPEVLVVALVEVEPEEASPEAARELDPSAFDYVWFTPRMDDADPCEELRHHLDSMRPRPS